MKIAELGSVSKVTKGPQPSGPFNDGIVQPPKVQLTQVVRP
jgi:hypothetical protein